MGSIQLGDGCILKIVASLGGKSTGKRQEFYRYDSWEWINY